jgi:hypothetical protein
LGRFKYRFFSVLRGSSSHESTSFWYLIRRSDHSLPLILYLILHRFLLQVNAGHA